MNSQVWWFATRSTGMAALVLLTASMVLGILTASRYARPSLPRFVTMGLHRNVSLLVLVFLGLHIVTTIVDSFAPVSWTDAVLPFAGVYRPFWLGLGALSFDLLIALTVTSLLRGRLGYQTWRWVHWASYACWPIAVMHGLGTGSDSSLPLFLAMTAGCVGAVVLALWYRLATGWPEHRGVRVSSAVLSVVLPAVALGWMLGGPLQPGWALKAGTPASLIAHAKTTGGATRKSSAGQVSTARQLPSPPFTAPLVGSVSQSAPNQSGQVAIRIHATTGAGTNGVLDIVLDGTPSAGGGVSLTGSQASYGTPSQPQQYTGQLSSLNGSVLQISTQDGNGQPLALSVTLNLNGSHVTGQVAATAGGGGSSGGGQ
jgi:sulfoxide reductase heme-binding subunit YedZ